MDRLIAKEGMYLTQREELPIENRIFVKELCGINATKEFYREATSEEVLEWLEYNHNIQKKMEVQL
jgi:hypothetical protein